MKPLNSISDLPKSLRIGLVLDTSLDTAEGVPQYVVALGEWLRSQGHDVHYLVGQTKTRQLPNIHSLARNIGVSFNGNRTTIPLPTSRRKLQRFIREQDFDVLHVQTPHHPLMAQHLILAAGPRTAVIGTFHVLPYGRLARWGNRALGLWLRPSLKRFDKMLAVSAAAADFARASFKLEAEVLPNVFDYRLFHNAKPLDRYRDGRLTILFMGRLVRRKGCLLLLQAVAQLKTAEVPPFKVVVCGRGPRQAKLQRFARDHDIDHLVEFAGYISEEDKPCYLASANIAVFPSQAGESFGIVLLEAMASGQAAVLGGNNPGYRSVLAPQPGLLFNPKDAAGLAQRLAYFMNHEAERRQMAAWGATYTAGFDVAVVGRQLLAIYAQALRKRRQL